MIFFFFECNKLRYTFSEVWNDELFNMYLIELNLCAFVQYAQNTEKTAVKTAAVAVSDAATTTILKLSRVSKVIHEYY